LSDVPQKKSGSYSECLFNISRRLTSGGFNRILQLATTKLTLFFHAPRHANLAEGVNKNKNFSSKFWQDITKRSKNERSLPSPVRDRLLSFTEIASANDLPATGVGVV